MQVTHPLADAERGTVHDLVAVDRYPLHRPGSAKWRDQVDSIAAELAAAGIVQLPGFLRPTAVAHLQLELAALRQYVHIAREERGAYAGDDVGLDADDPRRLRSAWIAGHVTRDMLPPQSPAQRLFVAPGFKGYLAACLGVDRIFEYADPLAGLIATVLPPGGAYGWHYDTTSFVVTISISAPDGGGRFEYVPDLRRPGDENLAGLARVLNGDRSEVRVADAEPGDLRLFMGRYSLHRVAEVTGERDRLTLVLAYGERPGVIGPLERTRQVYGRVTEAHLIQHLAEFGADGLLA